MLGEASELCVTVFGLELDTFRLSLIPIVLNAISTARFESVLWHTSRVARLAELHIMIDLINTSSALRTTTKIDVVIDITEIRICISGM